jgi:hypothetical protein
VNASSDRTVLSLVSPNLLGRREPGSLSRFREPGDQLP